VNRRQLDVGGRVEVRLAGAEADDIAARLFELTCFIRDRDGRGGFTRSSAADRNGIMFS